MTEKSKSISILDVIAEWDGDKCKLPFDPVRQARADRLEMIQRFPFFGSMIIGLDVVIVDPTNPYIQTAATDGRRLYYNPVFMAALPQNKRLFVHAHEIMHNAVDTIVRAGGRDHSIWNAASDYAINQILKENGFELPTSADIENGMRELAKLGTDKEKVKAFLDQHGLISEDSDKIFVLYNDDFKGLSAEEIYEILIKQEDEIDKKLAKKYRKNDSKNSGDDREGQNGQCGQDGKEEGDGKGSKGGKNNKSGGRYTVEENGRPGTASEREGMRKYPIGSMDRHPLQGISKEEAERLRQDMQAAMNQARTMNRGNTPAGMDRLFDQMNSPKIKWSDRLTADIMDFRDADYAWETPNSYMFGQGMTIPGLRYENTIRVRFVCDTSGSIGPEDQAKAMGELFGICRQFDSFELKVTSFDTKMYDVYTYTEENAHEIITFPFTGGGGTHFGEAFDWLMEEPEDYDAVIFFTDGYGDGWYEHTAPQLSGKMFWLITENYGNPPTPTWGRVIYYDKHVN